MEHGGAGLDRWLLLYVARSSACTWGRLQVGQQKAERLGQLEGLVRLT
jgi:hypothetical protein